MSLIPNNALNTDHNPDWITTVKLVYNDHLGNEVSAVIIDRWLL